MEEQVAQIIPEEKPTYDIALIEDILKNPYAINDEIIAKNNELLQETMQTTAFIHHTRQDLEDMFYGFDETVVKQIQPKWYEFYKRDISLEEKIRHPGLQDKITETLGGMQKKLHNVRHQLYSNGRTIRNMIAYGIRLDQEASYARLQVHEAAKYAVDLVDKSKSLDTYMQTDEFENGINPEQRTAILLAADRSEEQLQILRSSTQALKKKSELYKVNSVETMKMARAIRSKFSAFYDVIAKAVNQVNTLQLALQSGSFLQMHNDVDDLREYMHEAHLLIEEHGGFMYSLQEHLAGISEDVSQIPATFSSNGNRLEHVVHMRKQDDNKWITEALDF